METLLLLKNLSTKARTQYHCNLINLIFRVKMGVPVRCTFEIPGLANILQPFRGAAAGSGVLKVSPFEKVKLFLG